MRTTYWKGQAMSLTNRALWVIERNLHQELTLAAIADACEVSRYHLAHAFGSATGRSVMDYARGRRLSEAAHALGAGAPDILTVALESGYASHEAFSRAFRTQFGLTPEELRRKGTLDGIALVDVMHLPQPTRASLEPPEIVTDGPFNVVGLSQRSSFSGASMTIPAQWQRFMMEHYAVIDDKTESIPLGVYVDFDDDGNFDFLTAAEVKRFPEVRAPLVKLTVPKQTYAVFQHRGHVSTLNQAYDAIWNDWSLSSDRRVAEGPSLERANPGFNTMTGNGGHTIWIPVET
jgi:AraC family transcriptional regulator